MRRDEFVAAFERVRTALSDSGLGRLISHVRSAGQRESSPALMAEVLKSYGAFMTYYRNFSAPELQILRAFNLDSVADPMFWQQFVAGVEEPKKRTTLIRTRWGAMLMEEYVPSVLDLLKRSDSPKPVVTAGDQKRGKQKILESEHLTFFIREPSSPNLSVAEFSQVLKAIQDLYDVILKVHELGNASLVVGALDSGSDKSIDIIGLASGIAKLSDLLLQSWDRIRFGRSAKMTASIKTASDGLSLLTQISAAVNAGTIGAPEGEKLKRTVIKSIDELFSNGVYTKAMEESVPLSPSQLPVERLKLLSPPAEIAPEQGNPTEADDAEDDDLP